MDIFQLKKLFRQTIIWQLYFDFAVSLLGFLIIYGLSGYDCANYPDVLCGAEPVLLGMLTVYFLLLSFYGFLLFRFFKGTKNRVNDDILLKKYKIYKYILLVLGAIYVLPLVIFAITQIAYLTI